jgi:flagellin FlaB
MKDIFKMIKRKDVGSIGIGAMIVFIAMVLVAGIAASVLIQTSTKLEAQAMHTGTETTQEVAGGICVVDVEGHVDNDLIDGLAITVRTRAGSPDMDLNETVIILSDSNTKVVLAYDHTDASHFNSSVNASDGRVFGFNYDTLTDMEFGILVLEDADSSCKRYTPVINYGDKAMLFVDTNACFDTVGGIDTRNDVFGFIYPEHGSPGVIGFRTPASFSDKVYDLQ